MSQALELAYTHCALVAKREAKNFYYGFLLLPPRQRRAIYAAYAFARLCDDIVDEEGPDDQAKAARLAALRADLQRCLAGEPQGPVFTALADAVCAFSIPHDYLFQLMDGVEMDLRCRRYQSFRELERYCYLVASVVGLICIQVFGYRGGEEGRRRAADLGIALQLTNILRDVQEDLGRDRVYIPQEEMAAFGYSEEALRRGETGPAFYRLMAFQVERAREYYRSGLRLLPLLSRRPRACVGAMAGIYLRILERIARRPEVVLRERVSLGTGAKLALAGRELVRSVVPL
jgi:phytoene synthase